MEELLIEERCVLGGAICCSFIVFGALSVVLYKPWRRRVDRWRQVYQQPQRLQEDDGEGAEHEEQSAPSVDSRVVPETPAHQDVDSIGPVGGRSHGSHGIQS